MRKIIKMLVWKHIGAFGANEAESAYKWVMKAPIHKRLIRIWCIKYCTYRNYQDLLDWLTKT